MPPKLESPPAGFLSCGRPFTARTLQSNLAPCQEALTSSPVGHRRCVWLRRCLNWSDPQSFKRHRAKNWYNLGNENLAQGVFNCLNKVVLMLTHFNLGKFLPKHFLSSILNFKYWTLYRGVGRGSFSFFLIQKLKGTYTFGQVFKFSHSCLCFKK